MPNNCSTLIHRKQIDLQKVLRSSSEGKIQQGEIKNNLFMKFIDLNNTIIMIFLIFSKKMTILLFYMNAQ